jgi:hypothetical protein
MVWRVLVGLATAAAVVAVATNEPPVVGLALVPDPGRTGPQRVPSLTIHGGTITERARMDLALERFENEGLALPPLRIEFPTSPVKCDGGLGYFTPSEDVWRITICSQINSVYEHELAHAWERANLTDAQRRRFTVFRGLPTWSDESYDWNQRGVESVAFVIQQGLAGLPLPPALSHEVESQLEGYEMLTSQAAPRLVGWLAKYEVPCTDRPTRLSLGLPDASGRICPRAGEGRRNRWS